MALNTGVLGAYNYANIVAAAPTDTIVKASSGILHSITFNKPVATGVVTVYDGATAAGTKIGTITTPANPQPYTVCYDVAFVNGLSITSATAAQDITISYV